jgi:protein-disulfide isomerase
MISTRTPLLLAAVACAALLGTSACKPASEAPKDGDAKVVATIGDAKITRQELDAEIVKQIVDRQPDVLDRVLTQKIDEKVLDLEATKQKLTREQLLDREVKTKIGPVTDPEIAAFYEQNKARIPQPMEQVKEQIRQYLEGQKGQEAFGKYMTGLREQYGVKNTLKEVLQAEETAKAAERRPQMESGDAPSAGPANAAVTLVEFSDFQCPFCSKAAPIVDQVKKNYADRVRVIFRQLPLNSIHPFAQKAAEAALCAQDQGKFWELHDLMFAEQEKLDVPSLKEKAQRLGLDAAKFGSCLDGGQKAAKVAESVTLATKLGITGTPALYLNGRIVQGGVPPYEQLAQEIDKALAAGKGTAAKS